MAVDVTVSKGLLTDGLGAVSDSLSGGGSGLDLGQCLNSQYCPIVSQAANTGWQDVYAWHNASVDPITECKTFIAQYSQSYGGADSAANDYATMIAKGNADTEDTANNSNGTASGLRIDHGGIDLSGLGASAFLPSRAQVNIYGNNNTDGIDLASAFDLHVDAMVYDNSGSEVDATTPETGKIGKIGDTVLGDHMHIGMRFYLEDTAPDGGVIQWDWVLAYSFTA